MQEESSSCVICGAYTPEGRIVCHACGVRYGLEDPNGIETSVNADDGETTVLHPRKKNAGQENK